MLPRPARRPGPVAMTFRTPPQFPVLIGDIGGTNARFEIVSDRLAAPRSFGVVKVADHPSIADAIQRAVLDRTAEWPRSAILAGAGPILEDGLDLTNSHWHIRPPALIAETGVEDVILVNDFEAQAFALTALNDEDYLAIGGGRRERGRNAVVLGPGTGLGVAGLVHAADTWVPVPGEGGHVDLGPRTPDEVRVWEHLETVPSALTNGRVSAEQMLSGRGIINIYGAVERALGREGRLKNETCEPAAISAAAMDGSDDISVETMSLFCRVLGRVAGNLALTFLAYGGVHIGGGITQKIAPFVQSSGFRAAFEDKAPHGDILARIATVVVMHPVPALRGLAAFACTPDNYSLDMRGRRWSAAPPVQSEQAGRRAGAA